MAIEDRLEELFMNDANNRRVTSVNMPQRPSPVRGVLTFAGVAAIAGIALVAVILGLRGGQQAAGPNVSATPTATSAASASSAPTATSGPPALGTVTGRLGYPSDFIPALAIYALPTNNMADGRYVIFTERTGSAPAGSVTYTMQVPAGTYYFVAYGREAPAGNKNGGAYTKYVTCGMQPPCSDHTLIPVTVTGGQTVSDIDIRDWYAGQDAYPPRPGLSSAPAAPPGATTYQSPLGYTVQLPSGWRRSNLQSRTTPNPQGDPDLLGYESFTTRTPADEADAMRPDATGVGPALVYTATVGLYRNTRNETAMAYAEREKGKLGLTVVSIEATTVDGLAGAKTTFRFHQADSKTFYALYVSDGDRIWEIRYFLAQPADQIPAGATEEGVRSIVESFKFAR
jgi:hypothetical protein